MSQKAIISKIVAARGYQRKHRISRFPHRDRRQPAAVYAAGAAPTPAMLASHSFEPHFVDCLGRSRATIVERHLGKWAICTIASTGYETQLDDFFSTLHRYGETASAARVVLCVDPSPQLFAVAAKHGALAVPLRAVGEIDASIKAALYSVARIVKAEFYLCCDTDIFVVEDLRPLLRHVEANPFAIHAAQSAPTVEFDQPHSFLLAAKHYYNGNYWEIRELCNYNRVPNFTRLNSGVFAGSASAMMMLDLNIRNLQPRAENWLQAKKSPAADELLFSLAVANTGGVAELPARWNMQLYALDVFPVAEHTHSRGNHVHYRFWHGSQTAAVLHFAAAAGRAKMPKIRELLEL
jgi:hypothetical protein